MAAQFPGILCVRRSHGPPCLTQGIEQRQCTSSRANLLSGTHELLELLHRGRVGSSTSPRSRHTLGRCRSRGSKARPTDIKYTGYPSQCTRPMGFDDLAGMASGLEGLMGSHGVSGRRAGLCERSGGLELTGLVQTHSRHAQNVDSWCTEMDSPLKYTGGDMPAGAGYWHDHLSGCSGGRGRCRSAQRRSQSHFRVRNSPIFFSMCAPPPCPSPSPSARRYARRCVEPNACRRVSCRLLHRLEAVADGF